jgi:hypothetical protein
VGWESLVQETRSPHSPRAFKHGEIDRGRKRPWAKRGPKEPRVSLLGLVALDVFQVASSHRLGGEK